jgi:hypothetical protein
MSTSSTYDDFIGKSQAIWDELLVYSFIGVAT